MLKSTLPLQTWRTLSVASHPIKYTKSTAMQTEPDRMTTEALEKLRDELAARIVALETQMKAKKRGPPTVGNGAGPSVDPSRAVDAAAAAPSNPNRTSDKVRKQIATKLPVPQFKGKDAETYMFRLKDNEEAKTWAQNEHDEDPNIMERSIEDLEKRFMMFGSSSCSFCAQVLASSLSSKPDNMAANGFASEFWEHDLEDNEEAKTWAQNEHDEDPNIMERSIEDLEKRFMFRFAPKNHDAFQPVHKKQKRAANGAAAAGAGPSGSSAPNPTAPTRIFSNHLNRVLSYCEWDYYKKNALCVRCGEKGHRGEDCKKFPSAKANVVERMEVDQ
ncbi:hypothetical protein PLESTB_000724000 [Pleodorina starrii]|uniref:CCHC-type domain-containing protein n=1 Tax=Pleodorina starrii TaxID=330485 RepID=A0A9W6BK54_9CHLO|nr:hypothetical protein PLESTB_000724000 [Pleodorina starrii]